MTRPSRSEGPLRQPPAERVRLRLADVAGGRLAATMPSGYHRFGRVLVLQRPEALAPFDALLGTAWCEELGVETVLVKSGPVEGELRTPRVLRVAGETTETEVVEHGVRWRFRRGSGHVRRGKQGRAAPRGAAGSLGRIRRRPLCRNWLLRDPRGPPRSGELRLGGRKKSGLGTLPPGERDVEWGSGSDHRRSGRQPSRPLARRHLRPRLPGLPPERDPLGAPRRVARASGRRLAARSHRGGCSDRPPARPRRAWMLRS